VLLVDAEAAAPATTPPAPDVEVAVLLSLPIALIDNEAVLLVASVAPDPRFAEVVDVESALETAAPTPTKPTPMPVAIASWLLSFFALMETSADGNETSVPI
jgi:hypothetical protein